MFNSLNRVYQKSFSFVRLRYSVALIVILLISILTSIGNWGVMALAIGVLFGFGLILRGLTIAHEKSQHAEAGSATVKQIAANIYALMKLEKRFPRLCPVRTTWSIEPVHIQALIDILDETRPQNILELGCGISSYVIAAWVKENKQGKFISIEHSASWADHTKHEAERFGILNEIDIKLVSLKPMECCKEYITWYDPSIVTTYMEKIDLLLVDAPPAVAPLTRLPAIPMLYEKLSDKAVILLDDGNRPGEKQVIQHWLTAYPDLEAELLVSASGLWIVRRRVMVTVD